MKNIKDNSNFMREDLDYLQSKLKSLNSILSFNENIIEDMQNTTDLMRMLLGSFDHPVIASNINYQNQIKAIFRDLHSYHQDKKSEFIRLKK